MSRGLHISNAMYYNIRVLENNLIFSHVKIGPHPLFNVVPTYLKDHDIVPTTLGDHNLSKLETTLPKDTSRQVADFSTNWNLYDIPL